MTTSIEPFLRALVECGGSDLHIKVGSPPRVRIDGKLRKLQTRDLTAADTAQMVTEVLREDLVEEFHKSNEADFAYALTGIGRFRVNAFRSRGSCGLVFRRVSVGAIPLVDLGLPPVLASLAMEPRGLVLVTGPTGSGKTTTLAGMIDHINANKEVHVVTIEDPIEVLHFDKMAMVNQREVRVDTEDFVTAMRAAMRQDPDVILVGEMRDLETISIAIETAETGHLVFGTLHTTTAPSTVDRLIDQFPSDRQAQVRTMLSESLKGVISQTLVKKKGGGRAAAREVLLANTAVSNLIREGKTFQIPTVMQTSKKLGMVTMTDALIRLVEQDLVDPNDAWIKAVDKAGFQLALQSRGIVLDRVAA